MKFKKVFFRLLIFFPFVSNLNAQSGQELFNSNCIACHKIGGGKLVGPDLKGITEIKTEDWLVKFIKSSMSMINSGDTDAVKIFEEYAKLPMPDQNLTEAQIKSIIEYIRTESGTTTATTPPVEEENFSPEQISSGAKYFSGEKAFANKGAACNSWHSVSDKRVFVGGNMAKDLSLTYKNMGTAGIKAILTAPPFPAMTQAYKNHSLTEKEITELTAFIKHAGTTPSVPAYGFFGAQYGMYGLLLFVLLNLFIIFYIGKGKKDSVNKDILKRQAKTY